MFKVNDGLKKHYARKILIDKKYKVIGEHKNEIPLCYGFDVGDEVLKKKQQTKKS